MDDLIRRSDAIKEIGNAFDMGDCYCDRHSIIGLMFSVPSVTVEPKHGEWILNGNFAGLNHHKCSVCGKDEFRLWDFCPNCGAKMKGADE